MWAQVEAGQSLPSGEIRTHRPSSNPSLPLRDLPLAARRQAEERLREEIEPSAGKGEGDALPLEPATTGQLV